MATDITTANPALSTGDQTFGVTPGQAAAGAAAYTSQYVNAMTPNLDSNSLAPQAPMSYQTPSTSPTPNISGLDTTTTTANTLGVNEQKASDLSSSIESLNDSIAGKSQYQTEQNTAAGVDTIQQAINDNNTAVKQLQNDANITSLQKEGAGQGAPGFVISADQAQVERTRAVKALSLSSISDALGNNLVAAQHKADQAVAAKYGPLEAEQKAKLANLDLILKDPATTLEQTQRATAQKQIEEAKTAQIAQDKVDEAAKLKTAQEAATNAANFKPSNVSGAYYPTLSSALSAIANAKTPEEAIRIQTAVGLVASTNKSETVGSADTGYFNVIKDANGNVVSSTPITGGGGGKSTKPLTPSEITQYQSDYPDAGIKIGDSLSSIQSKIHPVIDYTGATFNGLTATLPGGGTLTFPNQQALDQFKKDKGIGGGSTASPTPQAPSSPIEAKIASMKKSGILNNGDIAQALIQQGFSKQEVTASSVGFVLDKVSSAFSSLFK